MDEAIKIVYAGAEIHLNQGTGTWFVPDEDLGVKSSNDLMRVKSQLDREEKKPKFKRFEAYERSYRSLKRVIVTSLDDNGWKLQARVTDVKSKERRKVRDLYVVSETNDKCMADLEEKRAVLVKINEEMDAIVKQLERIDLEKVKEANGLPG